jgi:hypothetical protein
MGRYLPPSWRTLYELTKLSEQLLEAKIADGTFRGLGSVAASGGADFASLSQWVSAEARNRVLLRSANPGRRRIDVQRHWLDRGHSQR